jgi:hypothetical protein
MKNRNHRTMILKSFVLIAATTALSGCLGDSDTAALIKSYDFKGYVDLASENAGTEANALVRSRTTSLTNEGVGDAATNVVTPPNKGTAEVIVALAPLADANAPSDREYASLSLAIGENTITFEKVAAVDEVEAVAAVEAGGGVAAVAAVAEVDDFSLNSVTLFNSDETPVAGTFDNSEGEFEAYKMVTTGTGVTEQHRGYNVGGKSLTYVAWGAWAFVDAATAETDFDTAIAADPDEVTIGFFAAGDETASAAVRITGTADYFGTSVGMLIGAAKTDRDLGVMSNVAAKINFATGAVHFESVVVDEGGNYGTELDFDVRSTLADGAFAAAIDEGNLAGSTMTGDVAGRLYGVKGSELGGTFAALHSELGTYIGSFGARDAAAPSGAFVSSSTPE